MNKYAKRLSIPRIPPPNDELHHHSGDNLLGGSVVPTAAIDTDLILDIIVLYTKEALADFKGRL